MQRQKPRRDVFLSLSPPAIGEEEIAEVADTLRSSWITTGPKTRLFESRVAALVGAAASLAVNSCTAALHTGLVVSRIAPGDEVITTPLTFASSVNVIEHVGARPVLADVDAETLCIDADALERVVTAQTRAVIPVHLGGHPADLARINETAARHGLHVVEDAAHAFAAKYQGRAIGGGSNLTAFSFYATKNLTTAEGGMLTGPPELLERARVLSLHGMSRDAWRRYEKGGGWYYEVVEPGFKYNMTDIQAAIGLAQLNKIDVFQRRRREVVAAYSAAFGAEPALQIPIKRPDVEHAWHLYVLRLHLERLRIGRDRFIEELTARNIGTSVHFIPIHLHPYYRDKYGYRPEDFPVAYSNYLRMLSLPLHPGLSDEDVQDVIEAVLDIVEKNRA